MHTVGRRDFIYLDKILEIITPSPMNFSQLIHSIWTLLLSDKTYKYNPAGAGQCPGRQRKSRLPCEVPACMREPVIRGATRLTLAIFAVTPSCYIHRFVPDLWESTSLLIGHFDLYCPLLTEHTWLPLSLKKEDKNGVSKLSCVIKSIKMYKLSITSHHVFAVFTFFIAVSAEIQIRNTSYLF